MPAKARGFDYFVDPETLRQYRRLSAAQKLTWLEEANLFIHRVASRRTKRLHRLFREGKI